MSKPTRKEYTQFISLLEKWDYHYFLRDNRTQYTKGKKQEQKLIELANTNTYLQAILKQFHVVQDTQKTVQRRIEEKILEDLKLQAKI